MSLLLCVGSGYAGRGEGSVLTLRPRPGGWNARQRIHLGQPPSYLVSSAGNDLLYVNLEARSSGVTALAVRGDRLTPVRTVLTGLDCAAYLAVDGNVLHQVNYGDHSVSTLRLSSTGEPTGEFTVTRTRPGAHPHSLARHPVLPLWYLANRTANSIVLLRTGPDGVLREAGPALGLTAPVDGVRHLRIDRGGTAMYSSDENSSTVTAYQLGPDGVPTVLRSWSTVPPDCTGNRPADLRLHPSGRALYVANRGHDSVAVFTLERPGRLRLTELVPVGRRPRNLAVSPDGRLLVTGAVDSDALWTIEVRPETGLPTGATSTCPVPAPSGLVFLSAAED